MNILKRYGRYGAALAAPFAVAVALLISPADSVEALALSNNLETTISLNTNASTGSNAFTTLAPITITCGVVDITAGAADGVSGVTLTLGAGWTFAGGVAPAISYAWGGGPTGDAVGTIATANSMTVAILASCDPGDVITFTGVQVKPLTSTSTATTIFADINTADVVVARLAVTAATPPAPTPEPTPEPLYVVPVYVPIIVPVGVPVPAIVPVIVPEACPPGSIEVPAVVLEPGIGEVVLPPVVVPPGTPLVCVLIVAPVGVVPTIVPEVIPAPVTVPTPAATGNGGFIDGGSLGWPAALFLAAATSVFAIATRRLVRARVR